MHLPIAHLSGFEEDPSEELQAQLQANSGFHSHDDEEGSHSHSHSQSQSQGSKEGSGGSALDGKPPKDLPCPRCQSMNTKFCYYNNYSVNQPRHFCRNCQRYWTVGGTLRNVPVGGGSRKKTRTRSRSDPYYRPGASPAPAGSEEDSEGRHGQHSGVPDTRPPHPDGPFGDGGFPDFPFHPSQMSNLLQLLQPNRGLGFPPFLDPPAFRTMSADEEAELQAFYEATQTSFLGNAASMMSSGLFLPELEPTHLALMHKAALWAEAQRLQSMARRVQSAQAAAWADQERECKPLVSPPVVQQRSPAVDEPRHRQQATSLHRRPGFWETALMHSRPSKGPGGSSQAPWAETKPVLAQPGTPQLSEEPGASAAYLQGYDESASWGSAMHPGPEMYY